MSVHVVDFGRDPRLPVRGVFAAVTIPRRASDGQIDLDGFSHHLASLHCAGIRGFVLNGATGEFCLTSALELGAMIGAARVVVGQESTLIAAIGGASEMQVIDRLISAESASADALLLPMPYFFPYEQQDLMAFVQSISARARLPLLLYNLPAFTTPLEPETTRALLTESTVDSVAKIAGIKDSSGSLDTVRLLRSHVPSANRVIGNDGALYGALAEGLCDGVVSGVACVLPELMVAFYEAASVDAMSQRTLHLKKALDEFIGWLGRLPVPWGLKMIAAERGLTVLDLSLPPSPQRTVDHQLFLKWFRANRGFLLAEKYFGFAAPDESRTTSF